MRAPHTQQPPRPVTHVLPRRYKVGTKFKIKNGKDKGKEAKIIEFRPAKWAYGIGETPGRNGDTIKYAVNGEPRYAVSCDYFEAEMVCSPPHSLSA